jgi:SAM-dependent methyltransferase
MEPQPGTALAAWRDALATWALPPEILAQAEESPWTLPVRVFADRAERALADEPGPSRRAAAQALPGSVLDVGAGAGAASLPLHRATTALLAVDSEPVMLDALRARARGLAGAGGRPLPVTTVAGRWPEVAAATPEADVVVCHHVLYNVPDLSPFVGALRRHARRRVVLELTCEHPLSPLNPYWRVLRGMQRPDRPTAEDALAALAELGVRPRVHRWHRPPVESGFDATVERVRRGLCLPASRRAEVADALRRHGVDEAHPGGPGADVVTVWWDEPGGG